MLMIAPFVGVFIVLFSLALFFLVQRRTEGYWILFGTAVVLAVFAVIQVILDVIMAAVSVHMLEIALRSGSVGRLLALNRKFTSVFYIRELALTTNKYVIHQPLALVSGRSLHMHNQFHRRLPICSVKSCSFPTES
jgi:hypothetical protein